MTIQQSNGPAAFSTMTTTNSSKSNEHSLLQPTLFTFDMKDTSVLGGVVCPETYHGTKMNQRALNFHTQLHEWSEAQKISAAANRHAQVLTSNRHSEVYLPIKKLTHIEHWTRDVNKYYRPYKGGRARSGSFMKIDVSKYNMKVEKNEVTRSKSAIYPAKVGHNRIISATAMTSMGAKRRFFGTDIRTVTNNLVESQMHYSAQRKNLYSAPTTRALPSAKTLELETEVETNSSGVLNGTVKTDLSESETLSMLDNTNSSKVSDIDSLGRDHTEKDLLQQRIISRSWSNKMLNVISIDDCKLTCRYRPQTIKETNGIGMPENINETDRKNTRAKLKRNAKHNEKAVIEKVKENYVKTTEEKVPGDDADDEEGTSDTENLELEDKINDMVLGDELVDRNNNETLQNGNHNNHEKDKADDSDGAHTVTNSETDNDNTKLDKIEINEETGTPETEANSEVVKNGKITFNEGNTSHGKNSNSSDGKAVMSSHGTSKTSYGRMTSLYSNSVSTKSNSKERKDKKRTRTSKINYAINDMVKDRKVMNSMERDFDVRTSQFGRTVVDKSGGSETFQKIHTHLRKKIETYIETHSAIKSQRFYEHKKKNSTTETA